ncbi:MAG: methyltransferase domain-containing protein [Proteobacteria bacterium]|nr:methyltransferase domain-containing protein [Pseudomonadota bacterium]
MWTKEKIEDQLKTETFDYQKIDLPFGLTTHGHDRSDTARLIFEGDLKGRSVLDVGSSLGFFSFESERRGATRVLGIDVHPESVRKAKILASIKDSRADFLCKDIEDLPVQEPFDVVLCLNVLHHLHDPLGALNRLIDLTREKLILEVATFGSHDKKKVGLPAFVCALLARFPIIFVTPTGTRGTREIQRFYLSEPAVLHLLTKHRTVFARVETKPSPHKGRFVVIAHKRRIGHLLVVGGPTSAGKKTLMRQLRENKLPELAGKLGTPDAAVWGTPLNANHLDEPSSAVMEHAILHYDIMRPHFRSTRVYARDEAMDLLSCADKVTFVTVLTPAERLRNQIQVAELSRKKDSRKLRILDLYKDPAAVRGIYESWIDFAKPKADAHYLAELNPDGSYTFSNASDLHRRPVI